MSVTLNTEITRDAQLCTFKNGTPAGRIEYITDNPSARRWKAIPWACGDATYWANLSAAQYYILACAEQMIATGNADAA